MSAAGTFTNRGRDRTVDLIDPATRAGVTALLGNATITYGSDGSPTALGQINLTAPHPESTPAIFTRIAPDVLRLSGVITATAARQVREAGANVTGNNGLWVRFIMPLLNIESGDQVEFLIDLRFKDVSEAITP